MTSTAGFGANAHSGTTVSAPRERAPWRSPAPDAARKRAEEHAAADRADHRECRDSGPRLRAETPVALEKRGVHVLRAVRDEVHHGHQQRQVEEQPPVGRDPAPERPPASEPGALPDLGFLDPNSARRGRAAREGRRGRTAGASPSAGRRRGTPGRRGDSPPHSPPAAARRAGRPEAGGDLLHGQGRPDPPFAAHADAEQGAQQHERPVVGRQPGGDLAPPSRRPG